MNSDKHMAQAVSVVERPTARRFRPTLTTLLEMSLKVKQPNLFVKTWRGGDCAVWQLGPTHQCDSILTGNFG